MLSDDVTGWLHRWKDGDESALRSLVPVIYSELHRLAQGYLRKERVDHTLQATALVHEAYLQVQAMDGVEWQNRAHFIAVAANAMRRILVAHARTKRAAKRGGIGSVRAVTEPDELGIAPDLDVVAMDEALEQLATQHPRQAQVVELRFFGGLTAEETAQVLSANGGDVSLRTVERDWRFARAWLHDAMRSGGPRTA